jgi:hypothetical protein
VSVTLAQLEQEAAQRVGPYASAFCDRQVPNTANFTFANFPTLRSTLDLDSVTNLWLLRRGVLLDGTPVPMDIVDRQRLVSSYDPEQGRVFPDRPWGTIPAPGEMVEFHHLDPAQELRSSVMAGLRRCVLPDTVQAQPTQQWGGLDLTVQFPWLTAAWQIERVRYGWVDPYADAPWDTYQTGGHLILTGTYGRALPMAMWIDTWRPVWSWVNGAESTTGPVADDDVLEVDLDYAASAAHIEAWHHFPARMQAAAAGNLQATRDQAAAEFSRQAGIFGPQRSRVIGFGNVVRIGVAGGGWVNGPW